MSAAGASTPRSIDPADFVVRSPLFAVVVRDGVAHNTVDRLKGIISSLNAALGFSIPKSGRKADHIRAIQLILDNIRLNNQSSRWVTARRIVRGEAYSPSTSSPSTGYPPVAPSPYGSGAASTYSGQSSSSLLKQPYRPVGAPVLPPQKPTIRFKSSPFHVVEHALTDVSSPSEVHTSHERGTASLHFILTAEQKSALSANTHQVCLYCTSGQFYPPAFAAVPTVIPIEFPPVVDIRVNGTAVQGANTRGLKKKPGTAPPVGINKLCRAGTNRIDLTYMNNSSPFSPKKFYIVANYVRHTSVDQLVDRLRTGRSRSAAEVKNTLWKNAMDDDEIQAGAQTISLKCPLSYVRITTPCRSQACTHGQCFDATSWYSMMEQTTTYMCPVCDKVLNPEELIMDGFFNSILLNTPESVEDVVIEPDAEWHSTDNKHHSLGYRPQRAPSASASAPSAQRGYSQLPARGESATTHGSPASNAATIVHGASDRVFIIDSDDEDDQVRTQLVPREIQSQGTQSQRGQTSQVIDLTLSSDDEQPAPLRRAPSSSVAEKGKRKASSPPAPVSYARELVNGSGNHTATFSNGALQLGSQKRPRLDDNLNSRVGLTPLPSLGLLSGSGDRVGGNVYHGGSGEGHNIPGSLPSFYDRSVSGGQSASTTQRPPPHSGASLHQSSSSAYDPLPGSSSSLRSPVFSSPGSSTSNNPNLSSSTRRNDDYDVGTRLSSYHSELYGAAPPPCGDSTLYSRGPSITPPTPNLTHTPPPFSLSHLGKLGDASRFRSPTPDDFQYNYNSPRTAGLNYSYDEPPHESSRYHRMQMRRPSYDGGGGNDDTVSDTGWPPRGGNRRL